jgi:nicotinamidase-related amidase
VKAGFKVHLLKDCIGYVNQEGHEKALKEMAATGIKIE